MYEHIPAILLYRMLNALASLFVEESAGGSQRFPRNRVAFCTHHLTRLLKRAMKSMIIEEEVTQLPH